jgi:hypothetical protein
MGENTLKIPGMKLDSGDPGGNQCGLRLLIQDGDWSCLADVVSSNVR